MITKKDFFYRLNDILTRPGMYGIQKVEDVKIIFFSEIFFNRNKEVEEWSSKFSHFVINDTNQALDNFDWCKIIRLYSGSDAHSLELFKELCTRFTEVGEKSSPTN
jgi:hypothetical protein